MPARGRWLRYRSARAWMLRGCALLGGAGRGAGENEAVIDIDPDRFEDLVATALDGLPPELGREMSNVAITVRRTWSATSSSVSQIRQMACW